MDTSATPLIGPEYPGCIVDTACGCKVMFEGFSCPRYILKNTWNNELMAISFHRLPLLFLKHTQTECTCGFSSRSDKCCTKAALLKTIPRLTNQDSVFVELSDSTTSSGSSARLFLGSRACLLCPMRWRSHKTSTTEVTKQVPPLPSIRNVEGAFTKDRRAYFVSHSCDLYF